MKFGILCDTDGSWYICDKRGKIIQTNFENWVLNSRIISEEIKWYDSIEELVENEFASIV